MNHIQRTSFSGTAILLLFFLTLSQIGMAEETVPLLPMTVKGVAMINGNPAPDGTLVEAFLDGNNVANSQVSGSSGDYCLWISGTAINEGKPVTFTVDGKNTGNSVSWKSGKQVLSLDLSVNTENDPENSIKGLNFDINFEKLKEVGKLNAFGKNSEPQVIESSVPEPDFKALEKITDNSGNKGSTRSSESSSKLNSSPGFSVIFAIAGIVVIALGYNLREKSRKRH